VFLRNAFVIALLLIAMILIAEFNSFIVPFIIMSSVILSLTGVMIALLIHNMPFGIIMTGIGVISLAGVVVNNAIVLIAYTRQLQEQGMPIMDAVVKAGETRLRPVMLTAFTTLLGLVPMATGFSFDIHVFKLVTKSQMSEWWAPMALVVIYGLMLATVLTLVVVPTIYSAIYRIAIRLGFHKLAKPDKSAENPD